LGTQGTVTDQARHSGGEHDRVTVSIVLPIHDGAPYVRQAIDSLLAQSFSDFELVAIDDGSRDESADIVRTYSDQRIILLQQENKGLPATLNRGIAVARGRYIARQDQDDVSLPERIAKQVEFLDSHPDIAMVGTWAEIFDESGRGGRFHRHPRDPATLKFELLFDNPFVHSSVMLRASALEEVGDYATDRTRQPPEDYELWSRIARRYPVANIPEVLECYREVAGSMSRTGDSPFALRVVAISQENLADALDRPRGSKELRDLAEIMHGVPGGTRLTTAFPRLLWLLRQLAMDGGANPPATAKMLYRSARRRLVVQLPNYFSYRYPSPYGDIAGKVAAKLLALRTAVVRRRGRPGT
jgi:glycosyltransferase involved in cell wall biosynthesis